MKDFEKRLWIEHLLANQELEEANGSDVIRGLTQFPKTLPVKYFYDARGSQLFEQICNLPEYYLTRTETAILRQCADEIASLTGACELVELGSGSSTKTRILLDAYKKLGKPLRYLPIDVSESILESSTQALLADYPCLQIHGLVSTYEIALERLAPSLLPTRMICFLGSTLGNFHPQECDIFFLQIAKALQPGEYFLLGIDLHKSREIIEPAYNDSQGVTAAFNLNMLNHLNWRFDGNFAPDEFEHWAFYNQELRQIEMHLRSKREQTVYLRSLDLTVEFSPGETIQTEISRKFDINIIYSDLQKRGLAPLKVWTDPKDWFALLLCQRQTEI